jgi:hypothetical protein
MSDDAPNSQREILMDLATKLMQLAMKCDRITSDETTWRRAEARIAEALEQRRNIETIAKRTRS